MVAAPSHRAWCTAQSASRWKSSHAQMSDDALLGHEETVSAGAYVAVRRVVRPRQGESRGLSNS
eukprot:6986514-Alexandrium_andersonii.AAC.1